MIGDLGKINVFHVDRNSHSQTKKNIFSFIFPITTKVTIHSPVSSILGRGFFCLFVLGGVGGRDYTASVLVLKEHYLPFSSLFSHIIAVPQEALWGISFM